MTKLFFIRYHKASVSSKKFTGMFFLLLSETKNDFCKQSATLLTNSIQKKAQKCKKYTAMK